MTPEQAWRDAAEQGGILIEFEPMLDDEGVVVVTAKEALIKFRFSMYAVRKEIKDAVLAEYTEAVCKIESDRSLDNFETPSLVTGLEGLVTMNRGPTTLWVGIDADNKAHGIKSIKTVREVKGTGDE